MTTARRTFLGGSGWRSYRRRQAAVLHAGTNTAAPFASPVTKGTETVYRTGHSNNCDGACGHLVHVPSSSGPTTSPTSIPDWRVMCDARDTNATQLISVDPCFTVTSAACDEWLPIRPGAATARPGPGPVARPGRPPDQRLIPVVISNPVIPRVGPPAGERR